MKRSAPTDLGRRCRAAFVLVGILSGAGWAMPPASAQSPPAETPSPVEEVYLVWKIDVDGGGAPERVEDSGAEAHLPGSVVPDGSALLLTVAPSNSIGSLSLEGSKTVTTLLRSARSGAVYRNPEVSPDGRWLAYQTNESGQFEIEVRPYPQVTANRYVVSTAGGTQPAWSPAGDELYYVAPEGGLMGVTVAKGAAWTASTMRLARLTARSHHPLAMLKLKLMFEVYDDIESAVRRFAWRPQ
jgi:hypothetical protein